MMVFIVWEFRVSFCGVYFACETILVIVRDSYHYSFVSEGKKKKKIIYSFVLFQELVNSHT